MIPVSTVLPDRFLIEHWQQRPCLMTGVLGEQVDAIELTLTDLLRHAADPRLSSRLVCGNHERNNWQVDFGPFDTDQLETLPAQDWTLLVQDLDKVRGDCQQLLNAFDFLPRWRLDDVMASVAGPGGSVGPHVDQYDVFLLQLAGRRHWQWSSSFDPELLADQPLAVLQQFQPEHQATLAAGDMLYLPPGVAHHGVATGSEDCITLSIGCRAPSASELLHALADQLEQTGNIRHYQDPSRLTAGSELTADNASRIRHLLHAALDMSEQQLLRVFGHLLGEFRLADELLDWDEDAGVTRNPGQYFQRQPAARMVWCRNEHHQAQLFCHGQSLRCSAAAALLVCDQPYWSYSELQQTTDRPAELLDWLLQNAAIRPCSP